MGYYKVRNLFIVVFLIFLNQINVNASCGDFKIVKDFWGKVYANSSDRDCLNEFKKEIIEHGQLLDKTGQSQSIPTIGNMNMEGKVGSNSTFPHTNQFSMRLDNILPSFMVDRLREEKLEYSGPNCFNTGLILNQMNDELQYQDVMELFTHIFSGKLRPVKSPQYGDLILYFIEDEKKPMPSDFISLGKMDRIVHISFYLFNDYVFHKRGPESSDLFALETISSYYERNRMYYRKGGYWVFRNPVEKVITYLEHVLDNARIVDTYPKKLYTMAFRKTNVSPYPYNDSNYTELENLFDNAFNEIQDQSTTQTDSAENTVIKCPSCRELEQRFGLKTGKILNVNQSQMDILLSNPSLVYKASRLLAKIMSVEYTRTIDTSIGFLLYEYMAEAILKGANFSFVDYAREYTY